MTQSELRRRAKKYWRKRWVRILVAVPVLAAAIFGEYRLANIPLPIETEKTISPVKASLLKGEVLVVHNPVREVDRRNSELRTELLPANGMTQGISITAHFNSARLSDDNMQRVRKESESDPKKKPPTEGFQQIDYTTDEPEEDSPAQPGARSVEAPKPCGSAIALALADNTRPLTALLFSQPTDPGVGDRSLEIRADGADLMVYLSVVEATKTVNSDPTRKPLGPGCSKTVSVGDWVRSFAGPTQLEVVVPAGESFRVWFSPLPEQNPWPNASDFYEPFQLVALPPVRSSGFSKTTPSDAGSAPPLKASSVGGEQALVLNHLRIGAEELQLDVSGKAMVQENGQDIVTFDLWKWMTSNPLIALLLSGLEIGLINWVRLSFKKQSDSKTSEIVDPGRAG